MRRDNVLSEIPERKPFEVVQLFFVQLYLLDVFGYAEIEETAMSGVSFSSMCPPGGIHISSFS